MTFSAEESINESNDLNIVHFSRCIKSLFMFEKNLLENCNYFVHWML